MAVWWQSASRSAVSGILNRVHAVPWTGMGGDMFRTWSGPGGSSHKEPLTSALACPRHCVSRPRPRCGGIRGHPTQAGERGHHPILHQSAERSSHGHRGMDRLMGPALVYAPLFLVVFVETGLVSFRSFPAIPSCSPQASSAPTAAGSISSRRSSSSGRRPFSATRPTTGSHGSSDRASSIPAGSRP